MTELERCPKCDLVLARCTRPDCPVRRPTEPADESAARWGAPLPRLPS